MADIKAHINALPAENQDKRTDGLAGLSQFIASHDFYELVKDSEAARKIRSLEMPLPPLIVRSSGINEDKMPRRVNISLRFREMRMCCVPASWPQVTGLHYHGADYPTRG